MEAEYHHLLGAHFLKVFTASFHMIAMFSSGSGIDNKKYLKKLNNSSRGHIHNISLKMCFLVQLKGSEFMTYSFI